MRLHHVQVAMPPGGEAVARRFYADTLGLTEVAKPPVLAARGGCWFRGFEDGRVVAEIHVSGEDPFVPAARAHPALVVGTSEELEVLARRVVDGGFELSWEERDTFDGYLRFHARDGAGNRVEVLCPRDPSTR